MQKPPDRRIPTILFTRDTSEWINRVNQKHRRLGELHLSSVEKERLDRWVEIAFVSATLKLEGEEVPRDLKHLVSGLTSIDDAAERHGEALAVLESLRAITSVAREGGTTSRLNADLLLSLHNVPGTASAFRSGKEVASAQKPAPEVLPVLIEAACRWFEADSFVELNPIEQASIVFLRLLELHPFERANERTALLAASLFTLRRDLPPVIISPESHAAYRKALEEGVRMNTKPMVELIAESVERTLDAMLAGQR